LATITQQYQWLSATVGGYWQQECDKKSKTGCR